MTGYVSVRYVTINDNNGSTDNNGNDGNTDVSGDFETMISGFPESYKPALRALHKSILHGYLSRYIQVLTGIQLLKRRVSSVLIRHRHPLMQTQTLQTFQQPQVLMIGVGQRFTVCDGSNWYSASSDLIKYYMDPRNFLDERYVFSFESLAYDKAHTKEGVQNIINGTFMKGSYTETDPSTGIKSTKSYADTFMEAGKIAGASPYYLASKARLELGVNGSNSSSGTYHKKPGYYNFFNIGASDGADAVLNGLDLCGKE